jgi:RNA polymerase sigma-B factor
MSDQPPPDGDGAAPPTAAQIRATARAEARADTKADATRLLAELHAMAEDDPRRRGLRDQLVELHMPLVVYLA